MRWIILVSLYVLVEIYAYQAIRAITKNQVIQIGYLVISVLLISYVIYVFANYDRSVGPTKYTLRASGILFTTLVPKLILVLFMFGEDIIRVCVACYNYFLSKEKNSKNCIDITLKK